MGKSNTLSLLNNFEISFAPRWLLPNVVSQKSLISIITGPLSVIATSHPIAFKKGGKNHKGNIDGLKIFVTAPTLEAATLAGVGGFKCEEPLKLDDFTLKVTGVGSAEISHLTCRNLFVGMSGVGEAVVNVDCDYLKAGMSGVGSLELSGCAGKADISRGGIGSVNTKHLKIKNEE